jgi:hypothetical protein
MSDADSPPLRAAFPRSVVLAAAIFVALALLLFVPALNRWKTEDVIARLMQERSTDYRAISESLDSAKDSLGHYPESMEQWLSVSPQAVELLKSPNGAAQPYEIRFDAFQSDTPVIIVFDPGRELLRMPDDVRERMGAHLLYSPGADGPFRMMTEHERRNTFVNVESE